MTADVRDRHAASPLVDQFLAWENINHYRRELENGVDQPTRATMLRQLVEEENHLGFTREQLAKLDQHISRLGEIMVRHVQLMDKPQYNGPSAERASMVLATYKELMAAYVALRQRIAAAVAEA
jgi:hypothetical protein